MDTWAGNGKRVAVGVSDGNNGAGSVGVIVPANVGVGCGVTGNAVGTGPGG